MYNQDIGILIIVLLVTIALFFALREVNCWYWKINKRIELMEEQNEILKKLLSGTKIPEEHLDSGGKTLN